MEKSAKPKKKYWGVLKIDNGVNKLFSGTFSQCWDWLLKNHSEKTLTEIQLLGIYIGRTS